MQAPLLQTKLYIPPLQPERVSRPRLLKRLNAGLCSGRQLTLVSAPAGFGKTTCITEWVRGLGWPVAWLSLDPEDDDPGRFFVYLLAAVQGVEANLGRELAGVLRAGQLPPAEIISTTLINDLLAWQGRMLLVLDDLHVIQDRFILQVLGSLAAELPSTLHLALLTREDPPLPLARLRANNQMTEIRARDLRFTGPEANCFLNEAMGLALSQADIAVLEDKTEGWIVGLQLAGLALSAQSPPQSLQSPLPARERMTPSGFIAALSGSHRFILSYLTEQVLEQQSEEIQHFLLQTAVLDKLTGDLCDAVTGRSDSRVLLEKLFSANLFVISLDDNQQWYRYHHLFADLLRELQNRRHKDETAELHGRASGWYAQRGMIGEAIQHALRAEDYALAVALLEDHAPDMIMQGYAKTMHGWVQAIPAQWAAQSPRTHLAFAWMHLLRGAYPQASPYLEQLQGAFASRDKSHLGKEEPSLEAEWLVMQSLLRYGQGEPTASMAMATRALDIAPEQDSRVRSLAYWALASGCRQIGDYNRAVETYQLAIQHGRAAGNQVAEMMSTVGLALMAFEHGQLHLAHEITAPVIGRLERSDTRHPISAVVYGVLGEVRYQWGQIELARQDALRALQLSALGGYNSGLLSCRTLLSRLFQLAGDLEAAGGEIQQAVDLLRLEAPDDMQREVVSQQVRLYLARGRPTAAELALQGQGFSFGDAFCFPDLPSGQSVSYATGLLYNSSLRVLLYAGQAGRDGIRLRPGVALADRLIAGALQGQCIPVVLEALLLRAQMQALLGNEQAELGASRADYRRALEIGEPEGFIGLFVEQGPPVAAALAEMVEHHELGNIPSKYVESILAAFPRSQPAIEMPELAEPSALVEPLTNRELEVLGSMAQGLTYKEIAARLFISLNTVRFHVKAIYGKLNVNNRTQAVESARQLQIL